MRLSKPNADVQWINSIYQRRILDMDWNDFTRQIEPFGGKRDIRFEKRWHFESYSLAEYWMEYLESTYGILSTVEAGCILQPVYQSTLVYAVMCAGNKTLRKRYQAMRRKEKRYGSRHPTLVRNGSGVVQFGSSRS